MPSTSLWSKYTVLNLRPNFVLILLSVSKLHPYFSSSKSKLILSKPMLNFPFSPSSKYPYYYLCCMCSEADCAIVAAFCGFCLLRCLHFSSVFMHHAKKIVERSGLPGYDAWFVGDYFLSFRRIMVPSSLRVKQSKKRNPWRWRYYDLDERYPLDATIYLLL